MACGNLRRQHYFCVCLISHKPHFILSFKCWVFCKLFCVSFVFQQLKSLLSLKHGRLTKLRRWRALQTRMAEILPPSTEGPRVIINIQNKLPVIVGPYGLLINLGLYPLVNIEFNYCRYQKGSLHNQRRIFLRHCYRVKMQTVNRRKCVKMKYPYTWILTLGSDSAVVHLHLNEFSRYFVVTFGINYGSSTQTIIQNNRN